MSVDEIIRLNVGGRLLTTTRTTLTKNKGSMLEKMFSAENPLPPARLVDGAYFIDADPDVFNSILTWLRHEVLDLKNVSPDHLAAAASYFGLEDMQLQLSDLNVPKGDNEIIRLNVGGRLFTTTRTTLAKQKNSELAKMFSGKATLPLLQCIDGAYFIDEDPDIFEEILTLLRYGIPGTKEIRQDNLNTALLNFGLKDSDFYTHRGQTRRIPNYRHDQF